MGMNFYHNNITTDGSEQTIFDITLEAHHASKIFMHNMTNGDTIKVKIYDWDAEGSTYRLHDEIIFENVQSKPSWFFNFLPSERYKVSIQRTAGTDRSYNWTRIEVT
jgi:hypothetical protein